MDNKKVWLATTKLAPCAKQMVLQKKLSWVSSSSALSEQFSAAVVSLSQSGAVAVEQRESHNLLQPPQLPTISRFQEKLQWVSNNMDKLQWTSNNTDNPNMDNRPMAKFNKIK